MKLLDHLFTLICVSVFCGMIPQACSSHPTTPPAGTDCVAACERLGPNNADHPHGLNCLEDGGRSPKGLACVQWLCPSVTTERAACMSHSATCEAADACR
jgi:hypothetical protein